MQRKTNNDIKKIFIYFLGLFSVVFIVSFSVLFFVEKKIRQESFDEARTHEENLIKLEKEYLNKEFNAVLSDLFYIKNTFLNEYDAGRTNENIISNWLEFSAQKKIYDQIRYIDERGQEIIRVNLSSKGSYLVPATHLQNKAGRYYFYEAAKLGPDSVYISPLDLNIENGRVEEPYKPMIRFSATLYDDDGDFIGIIIFNYLAEKTLNEFRQLAENSMGEVELVNEEGYWLSGINSDKEWTFMFEQKRDVSFTSENPEQWDLVKSGKGHILDEKGLTVYDTMDLDKDLYEYKETAGDSQIKFGEKNWHVISLINRKSGLKNIFADNNVIVSAYILKNNILYFILLFIFSLITSALINSNRKAFEKIKFHAECDPLTKLYNRRAGLQKLSDIQPGDERRKLLIGLCYMDINGLKQVNDILGHAKGDELIKTVSDIFRKVLREEDFAIRMGGDEFLAVIMNADYEQSEKVWKRIEVECEKINIEENREYIISISHGIEIYENVTNMEIDELIGKADEKMYTEKAEIKRNLNVIREKK